MDFTFEPQLVSATDRNEGLGFTVKHLWRRQTGGETELSHTLDRTYAYRSVRELRWYLAEKFGLPVGDLELHRA